MKRILMFLVIMLLPLSIWAMTPVSDSELSNVTGQAGVNINPDLTMDITINTMAWGDADGIQTVMNPWATVVAGGYIGVKNFNITNLKVRLRGDDEYNNFDFDTQVKPITIDVATGTKVVGFDGSASVSDTRTFVRFGLGALQISMDELAFDVSLGAHGAYPTTPTLNQNMGVVTLGAMDVYVNPNSYVDIYSHAGSGVNFDLNVTLDRVAIPYLSLGDRDGVPGGISSGSVTWGTNGGTIQDGYIGLADFRIGDDDNPAVTISGNVAIDIASTGNGVYSELQTIMAQMMSAGPSLTPIIQGGILAAIAALDPSDPAEAAQIAYLQSRGIMQAGYEYDYTDEESVAAFMEGMALIGHGTAGKTLTYINAELYSICTGYGITYNPALTDLSVVHISFPALFKVNVAKMVARVVLADTANLNYSGTNVYNPTLGYSYVPGTCTELGDIYIGKLNVEIGAGSWVDIWAH